jgi:hypothetical protein
MPDTLPAMTPPATVCLLRLSAIGDTCHVVPLLRTLQRVWPQTRFTWLIGRAEARLMLPLLPEVEFITVDKRAGLTGLRALRRSLADRRFDLLLHLQLSLRASAVAAVVPARRKLGFDRARARELQWLFTDAKIAPRQREHVLDSFLGFADACGVHDRVLAWDLPLPADALDYARTHIPDGTRALVISACSSHERRNWLPESPRMPCAVMASRSSSPVAPDPWNAPWPTPSSRLATNRSPIRSARTPCPRCSHCSRVRRPSWPRTPVLPTWRPWSARPWSGSTPVRTPRAAGRTSRGDGASTPSQRPL